MSQPSLKAWLEAARPRTLPLAASSILLGSFAALHYGYFDAYVFLLALLTTLFLQILSNLANDYGDNIHGADHEGRKGPLRQTQSGAISKRQMKRAIGSFVFLSFVCGLSLLFVAFPENYLQIGGFLLLGLTAIVAALNYTMGTKPYGYAGLGDVFVLFFFGFVGVGGSFYLYVHALPWELLLLCWTIGALATAVLNLNNMRDIHSDQRAGKRSIPVRLGYIRARYYHAFLLLSALITAITYFSQSTFPWYVQLVIIWLFLAPAIGSHLVKVFRQTDHEQLDPYLKQVALISLLFSLLYGVSALFT